MSPESLDHGAAPWPAKTNLMNVVQALAQLFFAVLFGFKSCKVNTCKVNTAG